MAKTWVGISGWVYPGWEGTFYPEELAKKKQLEYASKILSSIEINGTFYALQKPSTFQKWYQETPSGFIFSIKAPQFITHVLRIKEVADPVANFFASGVLALKEKQGPILWQFPPNVMLKDDRFERFLKLLPYNSLDAATLAAKHSKKMEGRVYLEAGGSRPIRHALEFRHKSFLHPDFIALLKHYGVAFVMAHEGGEKAPYTEEPTANFVYARLHGEGKKYSKGYPPKEIKAWTEKIKAWNQSNLDAYIYFSNEAKVYSPKGALALLKSLGT